MKTFHCSACQALVFFENTQCLQCDRPLAVVAVGAEMVALTSAQNGHWRPIAGGKVGKGSYKLCANYSEHGVCNWALDSGDPEALCLCCRLTDTIPDLSVVDNQQAWAKLEMAKRRLIYTLFALGLPVSNRREDPEHGLEFRFLSDTFRANGDQSRVLTGHDNGLITINVAEADDVFRESQRQQHHEPYRTLLGHFRHEIGHYYWDLLVAQGEAIDDFRRVFGDERSDYQAALKQHYEHGAPANWQDNFISEYATTHPWEDWAETWAHVMHMVDALETAHCVGMSLRPLRRDEPSLRVPADPTDSNLGDFDRWVSEWGTLTYALNGLTRGLGLPDAYPFVLSAAIIEKLRFVRQVIVRAAAPDSQRIQTEAAAAG